MPRFILIADDAMLDAMGRIIRPLLPDHWTFHGVPLGDDGWSNVNHMADINAAVALAIDSHRLHDIKISSELTERLLALKVCRRCTTLLIRPDNVKDIEFTSPYGAIDGYVANRDLSVQLPLMLARLKPGPNQISDDSSTLPQA